jgi:insertion element IS1 protein InsB
MVILGKKQAHCLPREDLIGDAWIGLSLDRESGLILSGRVGKHTDDFLRELIWNTEGKTAATVWSTDSWKADERQLSDEIELWVGKLGTQRLERVNGILRQQTGTLHRRQNKFSKLWERTEMTMRLAITYYNWIWSNSWTGDTAAQRAGLALEPWNWWNVLTYPTLL